MTMPRTPKTKRMKFVLNTCDIASDTCHEKTIEVTANLDPATGTYQITDKQLNLAIGERDLTWDGDNEYVLRAYDQKGKQVCELIRVKEDKPAPKTKQYRFILYTYDLWSDGEGGLTVNDVYQQGEIEIVARLNLPFFDVMNHPIYTITDKQLNRAIGARGLTWDGDEEYILYASDKKGNPVCELRRIKEN
jgi:hypothetical protein